MDDKPTPPSFMILPDNHKPRDPPSIWHAIDLPHEAFERLAAGGVWRVQEPRREPVRLDTRPGDPCQEVYRVAVYRLGRAIKHGSATVLGQWEGDEDWIEVGWIERG